MNGFPIPLISGFLISALSMPLLLLVARRFGIVDSPAHRKTHIRPIPYLGGLGIVFGFVLSPCIYYYLFPIRAVGGDIERFAMLTCPAVIACILGVFDDKHPIRAKHKLLVQVAIVFAFVVFGYRIELLELPGVRGSYGLFMFESIPLTMGWMLAVINGVNLVDGVDGLAASVNAVIFAAITFLALSIGEPDWLVAVIAISALGATLGFLLFNWQPAKIYMGDAGSLACGTLIATLLLALGQHSIGGTISGKNGEIVFQPYSYQIVKITLIAFYPIMEISLSIIRRFLSGKPVGSGDKGHVHHRLLRWGWSPRIVCLAAAGISALAGATVVFAQLQYRALASSLLLSGGVIFVLMLQACGFLELFHPRSIQGNRPFFLIANHFTSMQHIKLKLAHNLNEISALIDQTCIEFGVAKHSMRVISNGVCLELNWVKPATAQGSILLPVDSLASPETTSAFSDTITLASGSTAEWTFEPHTIEEEIDVEYRVLMSEFMRNALGCAERLQRELSPGTTRTLENGVTSASVRSSELRRRKNSGRNLFPTSPSSRPPMRNEK